MKIIKLEEEQLIKQYTKDWELFDQCKVGDKLEIDDGFKGIVINGGCINENYIRNGKAVFLTQYNKHQYNGIAHEVFYKFIKLNQFKIINNTNEKSSVGNKPQHFENYVGEDGEFHYSDEVSAFGTHHESDDENSRFAGCIIISDDVEQLELFTEEGNKYLRFKRKQ